MDHRDILRGLDAEQRAYLTEKSDGKGLTRLAAHWAPIFLIGGAIAAQVPFWQVLVLPQGILIIFCFTLLHETSHRTVFRTLWLNKAVAWVCGFLIVLPPDWFRQFHADHHRFTQDPDRDPELQAPKPDSAAAYLVHLSGVPVWKSQITTLFRNALGRVDYPYVAEMNRPRIVREARLMLALYAGLTGLFAALGSPVLVYAWILPVLLGQPFLRLYLLAEHAGCPQVSNMLLNTRTTYTNPVVRLLAWNMPYHIEHHSFPAVPFHRLPEFHAILRDHLGVTEAGYVRFHVNYVRALGKSSATAA
ncbi:MAG: fatty acid desaturase family protein [Alphaproteobacteria bacterium]